MNLWNSIQPETYLENTRAAWLMLMGMLFLSIGYIRTGIPRPNVNSNSSCHGELSVPNRMLRIAFSIALVSFSLAMTGCQPFRVPTFDPTGARIFASEPTTLVGPFSAVNRGPSANQGLGSPAYQAPPNPPPCNLGPYCSEDAAKLARGPNCKERLNAKGISLHKGRKGELILTPSRAIAPVGSEVVLLSGICGDTNQFVLNQPLEWMLSNDSVGQFVEVGGTDHFITNPIIPPSAKKIDGDYAWGRTLLKPRHITRGTPTPVDDLFVKKGQAWISVSSASEGTSYITCVAPKAEAWDKRKRVTIIHWVDANWSIPAPSTVPAGQVAPLDVAIRRASDGSGVANWKVRYEIVGGVPAEFVPTGGNKVELLTTDIGNAPVQIRQAGGQSNAGPTHVKVDIIRPAMYGQREMVVESGLTTITWSAPALAIRVLGPTTAAVQESVSYRLEITNTGDQVASGVTVRTSRTSADVQLISSQPKANLFGNQFQWDLGDLQPGGQPTIIDLQWKKDAAGIAELCFELASSSQGLSTEACAQTQVAAPCIGLSINGPNTVEQGQTIHFDLEIVNQCEQPLERVNLQIAYDAGLQIPGVSNKIEYDIEAPIQPGQKETVGVDFIASQPGVSCFSLDIVADGGHTAQAKRCVTIVQGTQPSVDLQISRVTAAQTGQQVTTRFQVTNNGSSQLNQVSLLTRFSNSVVPQSASKDFAPEWIGDELVFRLGNLAPGEQRLVEVLSLCERPDPNATIGGTVMTPSNINDTDQFQFPIRDGLNDGIETPPIIPNGGASDIMIPGDQNVGAIGINLNSTVQQARVGESVIFLVDVSNQQTIADQNLKILIQIPEGMQFEGVDDTQSNLPVQGVSNDRRTVELQTRQTIRPGETISFRVSARATQTGNKGIVVSASSQANPNGTQVGHRVVIIPEG